MILDKLGKGIVLREIIALFTVFTCLIMPIVGYEFYTIENFLARLWIKYMPVSELLYFNYAFPAVSGFCWALCIPLKSKNADEGYFLGNIFKQIKGYEGKGRLGVILMIVGFLISLIVPFLPGPLQFVANLFYFASFAGFLYLYFDKQFPLRRWIIILFSLVILYGGIISGMFTIVAYMGLTLISIVLYGASYSLLRKTIVFLLVLFLFVVLQNTKRVYRERTWNIGASGEVALFADLFLQNLQKREALFDVKGFFPVYTRANQGYNVALVMRRFPAIKPFDEGQRLKTVILSSLVPRLLWPDKPKAGGQFNMDYYAGFRIRGWSTNVGPMGEAYGSFGVTGGIFYMVVLGFFIRWFYSRVFVLAKKYPLLILWIPVLFYQVTYSAENDTLQILNSLFKASFFLYFLFKIFPRLLTPSVLKKTEPVKEDRNLKQAFHF
ncbi:hypothetical protein HY58_01595 [Flavihumibacter sp. ZG627]|nr:hypothetical protein HY58_01595 [Flavihumibacter sp. ZG627]